MPPTYDTPAGIIGIRPFLGSLNYTRRSPIKSSFQSSWYGLVTYLLSFKLLLSLGVLLFLVAMQTRTTWSILHPYYRLRLRTNLLPNLIYTLIR